MPELDGTFLAQPSCIAQARASVAGWLRASMPDQDLLIADVALAVSEACTNAVVHAYRDDDPMAREASFRVVAENDGDSVRVTVSDHGGGMRPRSDSPGLGFGLPLIASLSDAVETGPPAQGTGTVVTMRFDAGGAAAGR